MNRSKIESQFGTVLFEFPICQLDWEMDSKGWVIKTPAGETQLVLTNHDQPYVAQQSELQELEQKYRFYSQALAEAKRLLAWN